MTSAARRPEVGEKLAGCASIQVGAGAFEARTVTTELREPWARDLRRAATTRYRCTTVYALTTLGIGTSERFVRVIA